MLQGLTFDYDGTIGQTSERQLKWLEYWAGINGKKIHFDNIGAFLEFYNKHCARKGGVQNVYDELDLPCDMNDKKHPVWPAYTQFKNDNPATLYPGIREAILTVWEMGHLSADYMRNRRLRLAINTTNTWKSIAEELRREGLIQCFDSFVTEEVLREYHGAGNPGSITKPSKVSLALTLGLIDSIGEHTMHIGDTIGDLIASHKVMRLNPQRPETLITVGAAWGYEGREKLEQGYQLHDGGTIHFNYIINKPEELPGIVAKLIK